MTRRGETTHGPDHGMMHDPGHETVHGTEHESAHGPDHGMTHATDHVDLVAVRRDRTAATGETTVVRLLSLLPAHWLCTPRSVGPDRITLRIGLDEADDPGAVRRAVADALADRALDGWAEETRGAGSGRVPGPAEEPREP
ncbi:hypothetical protein ACFXPV_05545 [Streptomyces sp. NPDC059118]|uniref:hypothetical protein n=1 Tax=unclassified Streptomyces TaxID=2593676 RepID=UPI0036D0B47D